jgi:hypothetical protein
VCYDTAREDVKPMGDLNQDIQNALSYIETHLTEELEIREIAKCAYVSLFYFQRIFAALPLDEPIIIPDTGNVYKAQRAFSIRYVKSELLGKVYFIACAI